MAKGEEDGGNGDHRETSSAEKTVPYHKLFIFADKSDLFLMIFGSIGGILNGLTTPIMTIIVGHLLNTFGKNSTTNVDKLVHDVSQIAIQFVYLGAIGGLGSFIQVSFWMCTGERQAARIRNLYLKAILRQDVAFFDTQTTTGEVIGRMSGDTILIQEAMGEKVAKFLQLMATFLGGFVIAFTKGWLLTLVMLCIIPPLVLAAGIMSIIMSKMSSRSQKSYAEAGDIVEQTIGSIRTVVSFTGEKKAINSYDTKLQTAYKATVQQGLAAGFGVGSALFIAFSSYALALWYGSKLVANGKYNGGTVINVIFAVMTGGMALGQASPCLNAFSAGRAAAYKMFQTISRRPDIDVYDTEGLILEDINGDIELKDVYFRYPARPGIQIFKGFSLQIPKGSTTALVGESGSGKSTVISLVERFYDPQKGEVLIDGINIKTFQLKWLRQKIGLVSQEPVLFATTIRENILYGKEDATLEEIKFAAEITNAAMFINKMPQGFDTMVGEYGTQLSGGQKQRIAIARAILKNPRILLLDEATSALDAESEKVVQEALDKIMVNRTTVVVAHRLTTVRYANAIAVVQCGTIVEKGTHAQLIANPLGAYTQLVRLQGAYSDETNVNNSDHVNNQRNERAISRISSQRASFRRTSSKGSSVGSSCHSYSFLPASVGVHETEELEEGKSKKQSNPSSKKDILRLASLNKPELPVFILGCIAAAINGSIFPIFGLLLSSVITALFEPPHQLRKDANFWSLMYIILAIACLLVVPIQMTSFAVIGGRLVKRIRALTFSRIVYQEIGWFDDSENSSGAIGARLSTDAATVRSVVGDALSLVFQNIATIIAGLMIAFIANWELALFLLALMPFLGLQGYMQTKFMKGSSADAKVMYEEASEVVNGAVGSIRTVASFCAEEKVMRLYNEKCNTPLKNGIRQGIISATGFGFSNFTLFGFYALSFWVGARLVQNGEATFGEVFKVFFALTMAALGVSQTTNIVPDIAKVKASVNSVFKILDRESKIDASKGSGNTMESVKGDIQFRNISFRYPTRPNIQIFRDLNLSVPSGKTTALVGESGSGKSTVISLLERFYEPESGHILLDGIDIKALEIKWLRQQMGLVSQEPILFNDTIYANIAYGKDGLVSEEQVTEAAISSNAHQFIFNLPQGYQTSVGERGVQLSGGQKQRIAIARAILKNPRILLLDEATSALDAESECIVQEALDNVMVNRTAVVVAHRLSTIKKADIIAVVRSGVIIEQGVHEDLLNKRDGHYASLVVTSSF